VDEAQLADLVRGGKIQPATLVWREGMANWEQYSTVRPGGLAATSVSAVAGAAPGSEQAVCSECKGIFKLEDMIPYGDLRVCASCKPTFMQRLAEGVRLEAPAAMRYGGFWIRFAAVFLDGILLWIVNVGISLVVGLSSSQMIGAQPAAALGLRLVLTGIGLVIAGIYESIMVGKYGATLGKMACGLRVVTAAGQPLSFGQAVGRYFAKLLSRFTCFIGFIIAAFDDEKRALHDHICNTRVVLKS
jgi:uncharacterized RDD family membrane protein YckC